MKFQKDSKNVPDFTNYILTLQFNMAVLLPYHLSVRQNKEEDILFIQN